MKLNPILQKIGVVAGLAGLFITILTAIAAARAIQEPTDAAAYYMANCSACHGTKAERRFHPTLPQNRLVETILKGRKVEKPPNMPAFENKGVNANQAKALITYMKKIKQAPAGN